MEQETEKVVRMVITNSMQTIEKIRKYVTPMANDVGSKSRLELKKAFSDMDFYLHVLELQFRNPSDEEYDSEAYAEDCGKYGI